MKDSILGILWKQNQMKGWIHNRIKMAIFYCNYLLLIKICKKSQPLAFLKELGIKQVYFYLFIAFDVKYLKLFI